LVDRAAHRCHTARPVYRRPHIVKSSLSLLPILPKKTSGVQRGTGSQFALLPPQNATGNFVKIVQRVPVKSNFDDTSEALRWIAPGMSVDVRVVLSSPP
jgi:hypothetical protein